MTPEFRHHERYTPSLTWDEWRKEARLIFLHAFHRNPGVSNQEHADQCFREWADEEFAVDFENGLTPSAACKRYFDDRRGTEESRP